MTSPNLPTKLLIPGHAVVDADPDGVVVTFTALAGAETDAGVRDQLADDTALLTAWAAEFGGGTVRAGRVTLTRSDRHARLPTYLGQQVLAVTLDDPDAAPALIDAVSESRLEVARVRFHLDATNPAHRAARAAALEDALARAEAYAAALDAHAALAGITEEPTSTGALDPATDLTAAHEDAAGAPATAAVAVTLTAEFTLTPAS